MTCNWEPIGKAEVIYTFGTLTGAGMIIGYFNIKDKWSVHVHVFKKNKQETQE